MRCKNCHYCLVHLNEHRCPECGCEFDPNDPSTLAPPENNGPRISHIAILGVCTYLAIVVWRLWDISTDAAIDPQYGISSSQWPLQFKLIVAAYGAFLLTLTLCWPIVIVCYLAVLVCLRFVKS